MKKASEAAWKVVNEHRELFDSISKEFAVEIIASAIREQVKFAVAEWKTVFGGFGKDAQSAGNKLNAIRDDYEKQLAEAKEALCGLQEAWKHVFTLGYHGIGCDQCLKLHDTFSSSPPCPHEENVALYKQLYEEEKEVYMLSVAKENDLQKQLAAKDEALCGMKEALHKAVATAHIRRDLTLRMYHHETKESWLPEAEQALSSSPTCPHKEDVALYKKLYEQEKEVYMLSVATENDLRKQLAEAREALKCAPDLDSGLANLLWLRMAYDHWYQIERAKALAKE